MHFDAFVQSLLQWKGSKCYVFWVYVCSLNYPPFKAHAPYYDLCPARLCSILQHYLLNREIFSRKKLLNVKYMFYFLCNFCLKSLDMKYPLYLSDFNGTLFFFSKNNRVKFHENPSSGGTKLFHADGRTKMTKLIVAFRNFANAPKITSYARRNVVASTKTCLIVL